MKKTLFFMSIGFLTTAVVCLLFMMFCAMIPDRFIEENAKESAEYFKEEPLFGISIGELENFKKDNYADCITAGIAYHLSGENPFISVISADYNRVKGENVNVSFYREMQGEEVSTESYSRYWHGSAAVVRLLYTVMNAETMRYMMTIVGIILQLCVLIELVRRKQAVLGWIYIIAFLAVNGLFALECMEYAWVFILIPVGVLLLLNPRINNKQSKICLAFMVMGMLTAFFDFLTTETLTFTIPFTIYYIVVYNNRLQKDINKKLSRQSWLALLYSGLSWCIGYAGMFLSKWFLVWITLGKGALDTAINSAMERVGGEVSLSLNMADEKADLGQRLQGIAVRNLGCLFWGNSGMKVSTVLLISLSVVSLLAVFWYLTRKERLNKWNRGILVIISLVPIVRFLLLSNHSYVHYFFTYRALMATVIIVLYLIYETTFLSQIGIKRK